MYKYDILDLVKHLNKFTNMRYWIHSFNHVNKANHVKKANLVNS